MIMTTINSVLKRVTFQGSFCNYRSYGRWCLHLQGVQQRYRLSGFQPELLPGQPKIKHLNFLETQEDDKVVGVESGTIDIADPSYSTEVRNQITEYNGGSEEFDGDVITLRLYDFLGYGLCRHECRQH